MTREDAVKFLQALYREMKDFMDDGKFNDSY